MFAQKRANRTAMKQFFLILAFVNVAFGEFVKTQHAKMEERWELNEADCGIVRLPQELPSCFRGATRSVLKPSYRIASGETAIDHEFPWVAGILFNGWLGCGGAIVNKRWVLTAAHCLTKNGVKKDVSKMRVKVGSNFRDKSHGTLYEVERVEVVPAANNETEGDDIGLIKTKTDIEYVVDPVRNIFVVNSICLSKDMQLNDNDEYAVLTGFGLLKDDANKVLPTALQKTGGVIYTWFNCFIDLKIICFDMDSAQACSGDSGSPLIQYDGDRAVVIGVISEHRPNHFPGNLCTPLIVATRSSQFVSAFVKKHIRDQN